jgi:hypothetical protein
LSAGGLRVTSNVRQNRQSNSVSCESWPAELTTPLHRTATLRTLKNRQPTSDAARGDPATMAWGGLCVETLREAFASPTPATELDGSHLPSLFSVCTVTIARIGRIASGNSVNVRVYPNRCKTSYLLPA